MPLKVRELKAALSKAGFRSRTAKGSHTYWTHTSLPGVHIPLAGQDGKDARPYQIDDVRDALRKLGRKL